VYPTVCSGELPNPRTWSMPLGGGPAGSQLMPLDQVVVPPAKAFQA
jgi:hypothetical protein